LNIIFSLHLTDEVSSSIKYKLTSNFPDYVKKDFYITSKTSQCDKVNSVKNRFNKMFDSYRNTRVNSLSPKNKISFI